MSDTVCPWIVNGVFQCIYCALIKGTESLMVFRATGDLLPGFIVLISFDAFVWALTLLHHVKALELPQRGSRIRGGEPRVQGGRFIKKVMELLGAVFWCRQLSLWFSALLSLIKIAVARRRRKSFCHGRHLQCLSHLVSSISMFSVNSTFLLHRTGRIRRVDVKGQNCWNNSHVWHVYAGQIQIK